jgi:hypothetical protein
VVQSGRKGEEQVPEAPFASETDGPKQHGEQRDGGQSPIGEIRKARIDAPLSKGLKLTKHWCRKAKT